MYMKRFILLITIMAAALAADAQRSTLNCTFNGLEKDMRIVVSQAQGGRLVPVDTLTPDAKGHIKLERNTADPLMVVLSLTKSNSPTIYTIMMPKEKITLGINYMPALNHLDITSSKGSANMALYKKFTNIITAAHMQDHQGNISSFIEFSLDTLLNSNPSVLMSAFLVTYFESAFDEYYDLYKTVRDSTIANYGNNDFVKHVDSKVRSVIANGTEAPDIVMADRDGQLRRLSDLRGKVVLIDFWASWCRPCRAENPNVVRLYHRFHDKGFEVFSVSLDNNREAWLKAIDADGLVWPNHVSDLRGWSSAGGRLYGISSIPATVLVDRDGKVLARNLRGPQLEQKLIEIFGQ